VRLCRGMVMRFGAIVAAALTTVVVLANPLKAQPGEAKGRATEHLKAGREHAAAQPPRWREACEEFQAARAEDPAYWRVQRDIGACLMNLERDREAINAYQRYLSDGGKQIDKNDRSEVEDLLGPLRKNLALVRQDRRRLQRILGVHEPESKPMVQRMHVARPGEPRVPKRQWVLRV